MLTFKKSSWVYRYNSLCSDWWLMNPDVNSYKSICPYFWGSVWNILIVPVLWGIVMHIVGLLGSIPVVSSSLGDFLLSYTQEGTWAYFYLGIGLGYVFLLAFILTVVTLCYIVALLMSLKNKFFNTGKDKPSVVIEYIKAKKSKICPMIKWED